MKKISALFYFLLVLSSISFAGIQVQLSYSTFYSPASGSYIEVYLSFVSSELEMKEADGKFYSEILVDYEFTADGEVKKSENYIVQTPTVSDQSLNVPPFVSQHRIFLDNGDYSMKVRIRESENDDSPIETTQDITLNYGNEGLTLSDVELFQSSRESKEQSMFQKYGYEVIPYAYDIVPKAMNQLGFYAELYNADKALGTDTAFLITYYLQEMESGERVRGYWGYSKKKAANLNVIMGQFLVGDLSQGNYSIKIDVMSNKNELLTTRIISFHKENPVFFEESELASSFVQRYKDADSLAQHIAYIEPIANRLEWQFAKNQLTDNDLELMKKFFLNFWQQRNAEEPEKEWRAYLHEVKIANKNFKTPFRPGYLSDRGFRYLKYGPPDDRFESFDEPRAYPYEIWYYNKVNLQSNRMIVFANKSAVLNDFTILHSDINGELYNKDWNLELHRITPGVVDDANPVMPDHFGNKSKDWTNMPR